MHSHEPLFTLDATEVLSRLKSNTITVEQYAQSLLSRIEKRDPIIKAWTYLDPELVLKQARHLDQVPEKERGPLHGLAVGIKDVLNTKDMPTQFGSKLYKGHQSGFDASAVGILRAAGAFILGKTTTTEFTVLNSGPETKNPQDPTRTPGGSSCGSAAAVADYHVPLSLGVQTGGSVIRPAAYTGVFAFKPTYNAISPEGTTVFSPTFDTLGIFARSIEDLQLLADVFAIKDIVEPTDVNMSKASIALIKTPNWEMAGPGTGKAMKRTTDILKEHGVKVEEDSLPARLGNGTDMRRTLLAVSNGEAQTSFMAEYRKHKAKLDPQIQTIVENKINITRAERLEATDKLAGLRPTVDELFAKYSAIVTPSAVDEAPIGLHDMGLPYFNTIWTALHVPVIHIPAFVGSNGMPVGVSVVAGRCCDQQLLKVCQILSKYLVSEGGWKLKAISAYSQDSE